MFIDENGSVRIINKNVNIFIVTGRLHNIHNIITFRSELLIFYFIT